MNSSYAGLFGVYHKISFPLALLLLVWPEWFPDSCDFSGFAKSMIGVCAPGRLCPLLGNAKPRQQARQTLRLSDISQDHSRSTPTAPHNLHISTYSFQVCSTTPNYYRGPRDTSGPGMHNYITIITHHLNPHAHWWWLVLLKALILHSSFWSRWPIVNVKLIL